MRVMHDQFGVFPTPRNLNYWWTFGGILTFMLIAQIATGVVLAMHYVPTPELAFDSVEKIMRDVNLGWFLRYSHAVGASMFFLAVYIHLFRGMYYGSYKAPREVLWIIGVLILFLDDRDGLHGLFAGMGSDELLGGDGDHQPVLIARCGDPRPRHHARAVDLGRLLGRSAHAQPALRPALSLPVCDPRRS